MMLNGSGKGKVVPSRPMSSDVPKRRSKRKSKTIYDLLSEKIRVNENGAVKEMTKLEAIVSQLFRKALAGNNRAYKLLMSYCMRNISVEKPEPKITVIGGLPDEKGW